MTNQLFCYWLQGYFEISHDVILTKEKIQLIKQTLESITEPLGQFTQWLSDLIVYLEKNIENTALISYFLSEMKDQLNLVFYHVVDNSYDTTLTHEESKNIHDGLSQ